MRSDSDRVITTTRLRTIGFLTRGEPPWQISQDGHSLIPVTSFHLRTDSSVRSLIKHGSRQEGEDKHSPLGIMRR